MSSPVAFVLDRLLPMTVLTVCVLMGQTSFLFSQEGSKAASTGPDGEYVVLKVTPKLAEPNLNVRLFPDDTMRIKGNAAPVILRLMWETQSDMWREIYEKAGEQLELNWSDFDPASNDVPLYLYAELKQAAWRTDADWEYPYRDPGTNVALIVLPDVQQSRILFRMLAVNTRADIKLGHIDEAIDKITVGLGLAQHYGVSPFFVIKLVQRVCIDMMLDRVEELVQNAHSPNLYWAIAGIPTLIDIQVAGDWERKIVTAAIPELADMNVERSPEKWHEIGERLSAHLQSLGGMGSEQIMTDALEKAGSREQWMKGYLERARRELANFDPSIAADSDRIASMSDGEVGVRYFMNRFEQMVDEQIALMLLPPAEAIPKLQKISERRAALLESSPEMVVVFDAYPIYLRVWSVQRRLSALRVVEALRDYVARNGDFPNKLDDITELSLPLDPFTNRPFVYQHSDQGTFLSAPEFPPGESIRYRLEQVK